MQTSINEDLEGVAQWLNANRLIINAKKTEYILIGSRKSIKMFYDTGIVLQLNGCNLNEVNQCKYLGVIIDQNLTWKLHIDYMCRKLVKNLFLLRKARMYITEHIARTLYYTIIQSHLDYCSPVWSNTFDISLNKLRVLQKRALRIVLQVDYTVSSDALFQRTNVELIDLRWKKTNLMLMFRIIQNQNIPQYLFSRI